ncbi:MAG: VWA domain-containing protein [Cyclobacteriaceae bacterium]|nr:VWA domain-containing protein [Cyclobacteriaceae bacterium]
MTTVSLYSPLESHLRNFASYLRKEGLVVGIQEVLDVITATTLIVTPTQQNLKYVTRTLFCNSKEDYDRFDTLFDNFWKGDSRRFRSKMAVSSRLKKKQKTTSLIWMGASQQADQESVKESKEVSGANAQERLRRTDFSKLSEVDAEELDKLAQKLYQEMNKRLTRRYKETSKSGQLNLRRTIRKNISSGGDMWNLAFKNKRPRKPRLVVLLDVSGSMDKYSFYLMRFIQAIQHHFDQVESFLFSTHLTYISDLLKRIRSSSDLKELTERAQGWSSGTTMGACFQEFNQRYAKFALSRQSTVIILSDGLDTGDQVTLQKELGYIKKRASKLIWLNPLKGSKDYQPLAKGMRSVLPMIDVFRAGHNLDSLLELERHLEDV